MQRRKLLMLNTSNHPIRLAYPYAFVQVSEVGRRFGIEVARFDLFGLAPSSREPALRRLIAQERPDLIGITLRNTDSLLSIDYYRSKPDARLDRPSHRNVFEVLSESVPPYFPVDDTAELIASLRTFTELPIMVGGFGFSTQPELLMGVLKPDFGVIGDAAPVFERWDDVLGRRALSSIDNLCFFDGDKARVNRRVFVGPSPEREYNDAIIEDRRKLFGSLSHRLPASSRAVPIEVMRGCPFLCTFCTEPTVKGNRAMFRDLDIVVDELEFLRRHDLLSVWFVCSEINAMGSAFALELAERVIRVNEQRPEAEHVRWYTYYLLRFTRDELRTLRRSGFYGGWNDIPAFDDVNLKQLRVPYRTRHLVQSIKDVVAIREEESAARPLSGMSFEEQLVFDPDHQRSPLPDDMLTSRFLTLFLGNHDATITTVRETLRVMDEQRLPEEFDGALVIRGERVFDQRTAEQNKASTLSLGRGGVVQALDVTKPTYMFSRALLEQLGSLDAIERFFVHVEDTFLSRNHQFRLDWCWVLGNAISVPKFHELLCAALAGGAQPAAQSTVAPVRELLAHVCSEPSPARTRLLFNPPHDKRRIASRAADIAIRAVLDSRPSDAARVLDMLEIPQEPRGRSALRPYQLTTHLYRRFEANDQLWEHLTSTLPATRDGFEQLALAELLERNGVDLNPAYKPFFATVTKSPAMASHASMEASS
jgi:hypothetical protein